LAVLHGADKLRDLNHSGTKCLMYRIITKSYNYVVIYYKIRKSLSAAGGNSNNYLQLTNS